VGQIKYEELRIRQAYAHRETSGKPALYTWNRMDSVYMAYRRKVAWIKALSKAGFQELSSLDILDIGCGAGGWLRMMSEWGADPRRLHGLDLLEDRIARAKALAPTAMDFKVGNAMGLDFPDSSMDLCVASTVFSSILDGALRLALAREMARVVRAGGWVMIFDLAVSDPRNSDTIGIRKKEILRLFPQLKLLNTFKLIFLPPLLRILPTKLLGLAHLWEDIMPLTCTHRLYALKQP
jgi:ubiquinone/menaquinone biosynthesis C-methylase UbiE